MKKVVMLLSILMLISFAGELKAESSNRFIEEFKNWEWSLGGMAYLRKADNLYYAVGTKRDLGPFFNALEKEQLYGELGYLNARVFGGSPDPGDKEFGYAGLSTNLNYVADLSLQGINSVLNSNFEIPYIMSQILATGGLVGAKRFDEDFWDIRRGYDFGVVFSIIRYY